MDTANMSNYELDELCPKCGERAIVLNSEDEWECLSCGHTKRGGIMGRVKEQRINNIDWEESLEDE
jgi:hypothetical protein